MKYSNIIFLFCCTQIMVGQFLNVQLSDSWATTALTPNQTVQDYLPTNTSFYEQTPTDSHITNEQTSASRTSDNHATSPPPPPPQTPSTTSYSHIFKKECLLLVLVAGGLIIACVILLISTLLLACKVCQLSRRIKMLSSNSDLISNAEYWMETAKKNEKKSETDAKETTVLMSDLGQTCDEAGDSSSKEEKGSNDGHKEKDISENRGEVGDAAKTEETSAGENTKETPATIAENSSTSKLQIEVGDSQSTKAEENSSAEGKEEVKDAA